MTMIKIDGTLEDIKFSAKKLVAEKTWRVDIYNGFSGIYTTLIMSDIEFAATMALTVAGGFSDTTINEYLYKIAEPAQSKNIKFRLIP